MMTFTIKKVWFDLIKSRQKKEEYRDLKYYYHVRVCSLVGTDDYKKLVEKGERVPFKDLKLRNGYGKDSPSIIVNGWISIGKGIPQWGAEPGKKYFRFEIETVKAG